jgi:transmembrane sensor
VSPLETPLKKHLRDVVDEATLDRIWTRIDGGVPAARRIRPMVAGLVLAAGALAAVVALVRRDDGPLRFEDGRSLVAVDASAGGAVVSLSDGSRIELGAGARFEPLESSGTTFVASLREGSASFDVRPGGPRHWQVECGLATVDVVGTRFSCARVPGRLLVSVERGVVLVRGERVPGRARRLAAGEALDIVETPVAAASAPVSSIGDVGPTLAPAPASKDDAQAGAERRARPVWRELARTGRNREAFATLGSLGVRRETERLGVADLLALADVARLSGHPAEAVVPLERVLTTFERDPQAPLAAFALGRLELDSLGRPRRAVFALERALALGVPRSLDEDVRARLVEAQARAGDVAAARDGARAYLEAFPKGRHRAEMEMLAL